MGGRPTPVSQVGMYSPRSHALTGIGKSGRPPTVSKVEAGASPGPTFAALARAPISRSPRRTTTEFALVSQLRARVPTPTFAVAAHVPGCEALFTPTDWGGTAMRLFQLRPKTPGQGRGRDQKRRLVGWEPLEGPHPGCHRGNRNENNTKTPASPRKSPGDVPTANYTTIGDLTKITLAPEHRGLSATDISPVTSSHQ